MIELVKCIPTDKDVQKALAKVEQMPTGPSANQIIVPWKFRAECPLDKKDDAWFDEPGAKIKLVNIPSLYASQDYIDKENLIWHIEHFGRRRKDENINPQVVKLDKGIRVICDGHHRLTALWLIGVEEDAVWQLKV